MDSLTQSQRSATMRSVKSENTIPEMRVRSFLHKNGFRYTLHVKSLPGKPDIVLPKYKTVIDVRGCFWHQHDSPQCTRNKSPQDHKSYWTEKFRKNIERDEKNGRLLQNLGWKVLVIWECEVQSTEKLQSLIDSLQQRLKELSSGNVSPRLRFE